MSRSAHGASTITSGPITRRRPDRTRSAPVPRFLHHDGRDLAAALQTIVEIGDEGALYATIRDAFFHEHGCRHRVLDRAEHDGNLGIRTIGSAVEDRLQLVRTHEPCRDQFADGRGTLALNAVGGGAGSTGLARGGVTEPLTTEQIDALKQESPEWLQKERATQADVRKEAVRIKERNAARAEQADRD